MKILFYSILKVRIQGFSHLHASDKGLAVEIRKICLVRAFWTKVPFDSCFVLYFMVYYILSILLVYESGEHSYSKVSLFFS